MDSLGDARLLRHAASMDVVPVTALSDTPLIRRALATFPECNTGQALLITESPKEVISLAVDQTDSEYVLLIVAEDVFATVCVELARQQQHLRAFVAEAASLQCFCVQHGMADTTITQRSLVTEGAKVRWQNLTLGGSVRHDVRSHLTGAHAESAVEWVFYAKGKEQHDLNVRNIFDGREGRGEITLRGVAEQQARVRCDGMIDIGLHGGGTDTYLTEDVLMLDPTAKVDAIPGLEIKTNDVKASHSATVSRVTEEDLFYFASRGIDQPLARQMYVEGFLGGLLDGLPVAQQDNARGRIAAKYERS